MAKSIKLTDNTYIDSSGIVSNNLFKVPLSEALKNIICVSFDSRTSVKVHNNNNWGFVFVVTSYRCCIIQFQGTTQTVHDILGELSSVLNFQWKGNICTITGLQNWEHYILFGSSQVIKIEI